MTHLVAHFWSIFGTYVELRIQLEAFMTPSIRVRRCLQVYRELHPHMQHVASHAFVCTHIHIHVHERTRVFWVQPMLLTLAARYIATHTQVCFAMRFDNRYAVWVPIRVSKTAYRSAFNGRVNTRETLLYLRYLLLSATRRRGRITPRVCFLMRSPRGKENSARKYVLSQNSLIYS